MEQPTTGELAIMIENLAKDGIGGIHKRLDILNGSVGANTKWRFKNEKPLKAMYRLVYGGVSFVLIAVGGAIIKLVLE